MPTGLCDIRDKCEVNTPDELAHIKAHCQANDIDYIETGPNRCIPLSKAIETAEKRWKRAVQTSRIIDAMRAGYCSVSPIGAAPTSNARH